MTTRSIFQAQLNQVGEQLRKAKNNLALLVKAPGLSAELDDALRQVEQDKVIALQHRYTRLLDNYRAVCG